MHHSGLDRRLLVLTDGHSQWRLTMERIEWGGWPNCVRLTSGAIDLIATTDVGPRVLFLGARGGRNLMGVNEEQLGQVGGDTWRIYGGHRLWHAPEAMPRSYAPDNFPVTAEAIDGGVRLSQEAEALTGIRKEIEITTGKKPGTFHLRHRLINTGQWAVECAPWALTVMAPGSEAFLPHVPYAPHPDALLPAGPLVLWPYTNMSDSRFTWGERLIRLRHDASATGALKLGMRNANGWAACRNGAWWFIKQYPFDPNATYPDFGSNVEMFSNPEILEIESLGPLTKLSPLGGFVVHDEVWTVAEEPADSKADSDEEVLGVVNIILSDEN